MQRFPEQQYWQLQVAYLNVFRSVLCYDKYCGAGDMFAVNMADARVPKLVYSFRGR